MSERCTFDRSWVGRCNEPAIERGMCAKHAPLVCCSCGSPATRDCEHTGIQFVCGAPLCANCEHSAPADPRHPGLFNLGGGHKPKEQAQAEWARFHGQMQTMFDEQTIERAEADIAAAKYRIASRKEPTA